MTNHANPVLHFRGHVVIGGVLECRTGMHIGGNRDSLVVGGIELPIARDPASRLPIIPGSSLKGRLRALLEQLRGAARPDKQGGGGDPDAIQLLFGAPAGRRSFGPTRLVVRDGIALEAGDQRERRQERSTVDWWRLLETDGLGTEVKAEAAINRITATAEPRQVERVVAGSRFRLELVLNVFDYWADEERLAKDVLTALALLEDSYLGGHGSRGYGRVTVRLLDRPAVVAARDYETGRKRAEPSGELKALDEIDPAAFVADITKRLSAADA